MRPLRPVVVVLTLALSACSGKLLLPEPGRECTATAQCPSEQLCLDGRCTAASRVCSASAPAGRCPAGLTCSRGVCTESRSEWCNCLPEQGCAGGVCVDVTPANECSPSRPDGVCPGGESCAGGFCVPCEAASACSMERPRGCCPPGADCLDGVCASISSAPCGPAHPFGLCPAGQDCVLPGQCQPAACSATAPTGACGLDQVCRNGLCERLPCSPNHPGGTCPEGQLCGAAGRCRDPNACDVAQDCNSLTELCSVTGVCLPLGSCAAAGDCAAHFTCEGGACVRDSSCASDDDCFPEEHCITGGVCAPDGDCLMSGDCELDAVCAVAGKCIAAGTCLDSRDCAGTDVCSAQKTCIPAGSCGTVGDCPPGHDCTSSSCVLTGTTCDSNVPPDCPEGQRCSTAGSCILDGLCVDAGDCPPNHICVSYVCEPSTLCAAGCASGSHCSISGGCIPDGTCAEDADCPEGEVCGPTFTCAPGANCGSTEFATTLVPPNMLIVLDRSGSMQGCDGDSTTRWLEAVQAVGQVTLDHQTKVRFGLAMYPRVCAGTTDECRTACGDGTGCPNYCPASSSTQNCQPAAVDVVVAENTRNAIVNTLASSFPGGYTPTGPSLRSVAASPGSFGLPDPNDPISRGNYILLVTDGEPNCDGTGADDRVNGAIEWLSNLSPSITTFVVGFAFSSVSDTLNCNAVYGGTSRCGSAVTPGQCSGTAGSCTTPALPNLGAACSSSDQCSSGECENGICSKCNRDSDCGSNGNCSRPSSCSHYYCTSGDSIPAGRGTCDLPACSVRSCSCSGSSSEACYYEADDAVSLSQAFDDIAGQIASCTYSLDRAPPDPDRLYVYLDQSGTLTRIERDQTHMDHWDFDGGLTRISFFGPTCDAVKSGAAVPRVVYGCPDLGG